MRGANGRRVSRGRFSNIIYFTVVWERRRNARKGAETKDLGLFFIRAVVVKRFSIRAVVVKRFQANNSNFCRSRARAAGGTTSGIKAVSVTLLPSLRLRERLGLASLVCEVGLAL
jgi:hypothetical protein